MNFDSINRSFGASLGSSVEFESKSLLSCVGSIDHPFGKQTFPLPDIPYCSRISKPVSSFHCSNMKSGSAAEPETNNLNLKDILVEK